MAHENVKEFQAFVMNTEPNPDPCVRYRLRLNLVHFLYSVLKEAVSSMDRKEGALLNLYVTCTIS